ncbi:MAG: cytochrome P460 family protein [Gemmatimonadales bacterium]
MGSTAVARRAGAWQGWFEGDPAGLELAVKDAARGGWSYSGFEQDRAGATAGAFPPGRCRDCHTTHAPGTTSSRSFTPRSDIRRGDPPASCDVSLGAVCYPGSIPTRQSDSPNPPAHPGRSACAGGPACKRERDCR